MTLHEAEALIRKRKYPTLNALITDYALRENVRKSKIDNVEPPFTLGLAILHDEHPDGWPGQGLVQSLEENLSIFVHTLNDNKKKKDIADHLLNKDIQFLNTLSELGLARHYNQNGYQVRLAEVLAPSEKDADIYICKGDEHRWIEVLNAAHEELEIDGFSPMFNAEFGRRLIDYVVLKYNEKFQTAIDKGWNGCPWVALDFIKNDDIAREVALHEMVGNMTLEDCAAKIRSNCPGLAGVVYYTYYAYENKPYFVKEFPRLQRY